MTKAAVREAVQIHFNYQVGSSLVIILNMNRGTLAPISRMNSSIMFRSLMRRLLDERNTLFV